MNGRKWILQVAAIIVGGFALALLVAQCREIRETRDAVIEMKAKQK
jgi:hypothetical protein